MAKQYGSEHLTQGICLRSEVQLLMEVASLTAVMILQPSSFRRSGVTHWLLLSRAGDPPLGRF